MVKIIVQRSNRDGSFRELYRNSVMMDDGVSFPFDMLIQSLKILYPVPDLVIQFSIVL